jgi:hypothetical protein
MKFMTITRSRPLVEPELLVRFVISKCHEVVEQYRTRLPLIWAALALSAVAHDEDFHDRLKEVCSSSAEAEKILGMSKDFFLPALGQIQDAQMAKDPNGDKESPPLEERTCRRILKYALREGNKMLESRDYEFAKVFELLGWVGLQPYAMRLYQFESVRHSCVGDPENLVRQGLEIIKAALGIPQDEN